jgi:hypothetical protein
VQHPGKGQQPKQHYDDFFGRHADLLAENQFKSGGPVRSYYIYVMRKIHHGAHGKKAGGKA